MKLMKILLFSLLTMPITFFCSDWRIKPRGDGDIHFVIVIPSYNNQKWYQKNIDSVLMQSYKNYHVIYIDDCSNDRTGDLALEYVKKYGAEHIVTIIKNEKRVGALANIYNAVYQCKDTDVVVLLDGDDWLAHKNVLFKLNQAYSERENWLVYSQFSIWPVYEKGWNRKPNKSIIQSTCTERNYSPSHLRTFYAGLFKKINVNDLMFEGDFFQMTWDMAIMLPMIEMASEEHYEFIPQILYIYNNSNPLNDHRIDKALQVKLHMIIASKKKYKPLE